MREARWRIAPMSSSSEIAVRIKTPGGLSADIAVLAKPRDRSHERLLDGSLRQSQLSNGLARVEEHAMARHPDSLERDSGDAAGQARRKRIGRGRGERNPVRRSNPRRGQTRQPRERVQDL